MAKLDLGFGLSFGDLYERAGLQKLDAAFAANLAGADADLAARLADLFEVALADELPPLLIEETAGGTVLDRLAEGTASRPGLGIHRTQAGSRAALDAASTTRYPGKKRQRELNRLLRKLGEAGNVDFELARSQFDVLLRFEEYLLIETRSWKGRRGTSIQAVIIGNAAVINTSPQSAGRRV